VWSTSFPSVATIDGNGIVTGVGLGLDTISYSVTTNGCTTTETVVINVNAIPALPITSVDVTYCSNDIVSDMTATDALGGLLTWYSDPSANTIIGTGGNFSPNTDIGSVTYYVSETYEGCESALSPVTILIENCAIIVETAFTPDGDNVNDKWILLDIDKNFPNNIVTIYNRWGDLIFQSGKGAYESNSWDGTYKGKKLPVDSYYYIIEYNDLDTKPSKGNVSIILQ
jgi:gliding motility-associated-like protein